MVPRIVPMTEGSSVGHAYPAGAAPSAPHSNANMYPESWTVLAGPTHQHMYHPSPQDWPYPENTTMTNPNYMGQTQVYQSLYGSTHWPTPQQTYMTTAAATPQVYPSQISTSQSAMHNPFSPDQSGSNYYQGGVPLDISPATTSTSMSSATASWSVLATPTQTNESQYSCTVRGCHRSYRRKAELDRHNQEKHGPNSGRLLCPIDLCPRGIPGEGFDRMAHLTQHLRSGRHGLSHTDAIFLAREHNPRRSGRGGRSAQ